jgi:hypothetical protein
MYKGSFSVANKTSSPPSEYQDGLKYYKITSGNEDKYCPDNSAGFIDGGMFIA